MKAVEALRGGDGGGKPNGGDGAAIDYRAEYEKLQKQLQGERVEAGRLKKANEENAALRKRIEELENRRGIDEAVEALPEDLREIPDDLKQGAAAMAKHMIDKSNAERDARLREIESRFEEDAQRRRMDAMRAFMVRIEANYPGFIRGVSEGGDKQKAWADYQRHNAATISQALDGGDFDTLSYHIKQFYSSIGLASPSGSGEPATPEPRSIGGGETMPQGMNPGRTYSVDEYKRILDDAQTKFQNQRLTYREYSAICGELTKAYREGRVK